MNRQELLDLIPAYALDALDTDDRIGVETLLADDAEAQALLRDYQEISAVLALTVPERPAPPHLRGDLKTRLADRKAKQIKTIPSAKLEDKPVESGRTLPLPVTAWAAAAVFVIILGLGVILLQQPTQTTHPNEILYNDIINQDDFSAYTVTPDLAENAIGHLVVSEDLSQAVLRVEALPDLASDQSYQLWTITDEGTRDAGIFHWETGHGPYFVVVDPSIDNLIAIGMTLEPQAGSPLGDAPTGPRLFAVEIASVP